MSKAAWAAAAAVAVAALAATQVPFDDFLPIERHTSSIPEGLSESAVAQCSTSSARSFGILGQPIYTSTHVSVDFGCASQITSLDKLSLEIARQAQCASQQGAEQPSSVALAAGTYCKSGP